MSVEASLRSPAVPARGGLAATAGWGVYCACSWTWCIGMFLPVILLGRFGWAGFLAFAIPNLIGCVGFGYVFDADRSRRFATSHPLAIRWFSLATIAFQVFFIGWTSGMFIFAPDAATAADPAEAGVARDVLIWPVLGVILTWTAGAAAVSARGDLFWRWFAFLAAIASGVLFVLALGRAGGLPAAPPPEDAAPVSGIVPLMLLGFLACPALDATFHRARQQAPSRHAFAVFGVVFAMMLVFAATTYDGLDADRILPALLTLAIAQWTLQLVFTIGAHIRELTVLPSGRLGRGTALLAAIAVGSVLGLPGIADERMYLLFLGLYAVPFPMYVIAAAVNGPSRPLDARWIASTLLVSLAVSPLGWLGFVENRTLFLLPLAGLTAIAGWVMGRRARRNPTVGV
jgi:heme/copper-type cytochrome/quinol oxidase subunit 4